MGMKKSIDLAENLLLKTYNRYPVVFDHGDGINLYDTDGNEYLDFFSGIAVQGLGYNYKGLNEVLKKQADKLWHISNYFYNEPVSEAGQKLLELSGRNTVVNPRNGFVNHLLYTHFLEQNVQF